MAKNRTPTPKTPLDQATAIRYAGRQIWQISSVDGRWTYSRLEVAGTPWVTFCNQGDPAWPDGEAWHVYFGTLTEAREVTYERDNPTPAAPAPAAPSVRPAVTVL